MKLGSRHGRTRRLLALAGLSGVVTMTFFGCSDETTAVIYEGLEAGLVAGIPALFEKLTNDLDLMGDGVDGVPTVMRHIADTVRPLFA